MSSKTRVVGARIPNQTADDLERIASFNRRPVSHLIGEAIDLYLNNLRAAQGISRP